MELTKKIKLALDETRILILGAQILLGFQFRAVFSDRYEELPGSLQCLDGVALFPMICVVALLITPGPYHRIVQNGEDSRSFHHLVTTIASLALVPFAIALGLDVVVTFGHLFGEVSGMVAGITAGAVAIGFWYGYPLAKRRYNCEQESVMTTRPTEEPAATPLDIKIEQMLTEARVILPGAQALFGFQLAIVFTRSFADLPVVSMIMHATSLVLVTLTVVLLMAPAAYHRIVYAGEASVDMYRVGSALVTSATIPLALGLAGDMYVVMTKITASAAPAIVAAGAVFILLIGLWHAYPLVRAGKAHRPRSKKPIGRIGVDWPL
jgi:hypothetical protein